MKKLFTVAALASVALSADFLGQHRPVALVKDGLSIVKDVKTHSYGKLIKDGVKITKELKLEDQELFSPGTPTDPKEQLKLVRQGLELMEMMLEGDDNEFFTQNDQDKLREMRDLLLDSESTLRELEALLPLILIESPQLYARCLEEFNKKKQNIAQLRQKVEEFEAAAAKAKTQTPVKTQPMRRLFAEDNEFVVLYEIQNQLVDARQNLAIAEKTIEKWEKELPAIRSTNPKLYIHMAYELDKVKEKAVQTRKELAELETLIKTKTSAGRKLFADDHEFFSVNEREDQLRQIREQIPQVEAILKEFEEVNLPVIKLYFPDQYEIALEKLNTQKAQIAEAKLALEEAENQLKAQIKSTQGATKFRKLQADDDELFNLGELLKEGKKIRDEIKHH